jgi:hypothetical protein
MRKLSLQIHDLEVESFETLGGSGFHGTINGRIDDAAEPVPATNENFCTAFCKTVGGLPCDTDLCRTRGGDTCPRTCPYIICIPIGAEPGALE